MSASLSKPACLAALSRNAVWALLLVTGLQAHAQLVPVNFNGGGLTSFDGWVNMNAATFTGYGGFPGSTPWRNPAGSNASGSGDADLVRVAGGQDGGPVFLSESLYFGSYIQEANALGGTLRVSEPTPVSGVKTITLQVQIGEAIGYGFVHPNGAPLLKINGASTTYTPTYSKVVNMYQNGVYDSPETGEEPVYVKTWAYQWNVGNLGAISSIQIDFSAVTHAQIYAMRLDQTSVLQSNNVFDAASPAPVLSLSGTGLAFGNVVVGSSKTGTLTIRNTGNAPLTLNSISYPSTAFTGSWSGTIAAGGSQNVTVTFAPTAATTSSGNITVSSNDAVSPNTIAVSGTGLAQTRIIGISGDLAFGNVTVGQTATRTMTLANTGNSPLNVTGVTFPAGFSGNWSTGNIPANGSQNVSVTFSPNAAQAFGGTITVNSNRTSGTNTAQASGTGTAVATSIISVPASLNFGDCPVGGTRTVALTISNTGNSHLNVTGISFPAGFSGTWSGNIPSGGSQTVSVLFSPNAAGSFSGTLSIVSNATGGNGSVSVSGRGTPPTIQHRASGTPTFNGSVTTVTHDFRSTPAAWLNIEFTDNLGDTNSWTPHSASVYSQSGDFPVTFTKTGDHRASWQRGMFFRLTYPTKP